MRYKETTQDGLVLGLGSNLLTDQIRIAGTLLRRKGATTGHTLQCKTGSVDLSKCQLCVGLGDSSIGAADVTRFILGIGQSRHRGDKEQADVTDDEFHGLVGFVV